MGSNSNIDNELVVFVDEQGNPTGKTGQKLASHHADTRKHLAFSCFLIRKSDNKLLVSQRSLTKKVWPGFWAGSFCGHPAPDESMDDAIRRRALNELGLNDLEQITCVLPTFTYKTPPYKGVIEHEFCPVFYAFTDGNVEKNDQEVEGFQWLTWDELFEFFSSQELVADWVVKQLQLLTFDAVLKPRSAS